MPILKNEWFVSIVSGVIVFIITTLAISIISRMRDKSKHLSQIKEANADILRALKPYVAEKGLPEKEIVDAIIVSTARKYSVQSGELFSVRIICEELIHEIIQDVFVSSAKKQEYSAQLIVYLQGLNHGKDVSLLISDIENDLNSRTTIKKAKMEGVFTLIASCIASLATIIASVLSTNKTHIDSANPNESISLFLEISFIAFTVISTIIAFLIKLYRDKKGNNSNKK